MQTNRHLLRAVIATTKEASAMAPRPRPRLHTLEPSTLPWRLLLLMAALSTLPASASSSSLHPVVLIPGAGGNQLEARLTADYRPSSLLCRLTPGRRRWFRLWFDPTIVVPPLTRCFAERMMLYFDPDADDFRNAPGVETRVRNFGSTESLRYLDPSLKIATDYMATLVAALEQAGYVDRATLFGAPYDFRYGLAAPGHPAAVGDAYLDDLAKLVESASASNGGKPVVLVAHSLGGLFALQLLTRRPPSWRAAHIEHLITLSTPWAGAVQQMLTFASGNTLGVPLVDPLLVRGEQRSCESNLWLLPAERFFGDKTLVSMAGKNYSAAEMASFLADIGFSEGVGPYRDRIRPLAETLAPPPGVPVTCIVGTGVDTPERLKYGVGSGFDRAPEVLYGDGDGTVNLLSLLALKTASSQGAISVLRLPGVSHDGMVKHASALGAILGAIGEINARNSSRERVKAL